MRVNRVCDEMGGVVLWKCVAEGLVYLSAGFLPNKVVGVSLRGALKLKQDGSRL